MSTLTILQHTVFDILLPTTDVFGDINFAVGAFCSQNYGIGCLMLLPVIFNMLFNLYNWSSKNYDTQKEKRFTWLLVVLNLWPQYQVIKLIWLILRGKSKDIWEPMQHKIKTEISFLEPFIEAIPQFFVSIAVFIFLVFRSILPSGNTNISIWNIWQGNNTSIAGIKDVFGAKTLGIDNIIMFPMSVLISVLSGVKCIVDYLSNGPMKITSNTKCGKVVVLSAMLMYVMSCFVGKFWIICFWPQLGILVEEDAHGIWGLTIGFLLLVAFPTIISIGPLARAVGFKTCANMFLKHPELFVLGLVTEYTPGPINGRKHYNSCCRCCSCWSCCTWSCCCKRCKPVKTNKIIISKSMSWNRMLYSQVLLLPMYIGIATVSIPENNQIVPLWAAISFLIVFSLGLLCFGITLHYGNAKVLVLPGNEGGLGGVANERLELNIQNIVGEESLAEKDNF